MPEHHLGTMTRTPGIQFFGKPRGVFDAPSPLANNPRGEMAQKSGKRDDERKR